MGVFVETYPTIILMKKTTVDEVRQLLLKENWLSAVGHEATATFLSRLLGISIPVNRVAIKAKPGDILVHLNLKTRLPEGRTLNEQELQQLEYDLIISEIHIHIPCPSCQELVYPYPQGEVVV
jgi:hypothetical protein